MKNLLLGCVLFLVFTQCKKTTTTNNYITTEHYEAWTIEGLQNITLSARSTSVGLDVSINPDFAIEWPILN